MPIAKEKLEMQLLIKYEDIRQLEAQLTRERVNEVMQKQNIFKTSRTLQYRLTVLRKQVKILERGWNVYVNRYQSWQEQEIVLKSAVGDIEAKIQEVQLAVHEFDTRIALLPDQDVNKIMLTVEKVAIGRRLPILEKEYRRAVTSLIAHRDKKVYPAAPLQLDAELIAAANDYNSKQVEIPDSTAFKTITNAATSLVRADFNSTTMLNTQVDLNMLRQDILDPDERYNQEMAAQEAQRHKRRVVIDVEDNA